MLQRYNLIKINQVVNKCEKRKNITFKELFYTDTLLMNN